MSREHLAQTYYILFLNFTNNGHASWHIWYWYFLYFIDLWKFCIFFIAPGCLWIGPFLSQSEDDKYNSLFGIKFAFLGTSKLWTVYELVWSLFSFCFGSFFHVQILLSLLFLFFSFIVLSYKSVQLAVVVFHCHILLSLLSLFFILAVQFLFLSIFLHGCILLTFLRTFLSFISTTFPVLPVFLHVYMYVFTHTFLSFINSRFLSLFIFLHVLLSLCSATLFGQ